MWIGWGEGRASVLRMVCLDCKRGDKKGNAKETAQKGEQLGSRYLGMRISDGTSDMIDDLAFLVGVYWIEG